MRSIRRAGDGFELMLDDDAVRVDRVVLTAPAAATADLLGGLAPDAAGRIERLRYNALAVVHLLAPECARRGLGCQVSFSEDLATRGITWNDSMFGRAGRSGVYTAYLGGAKRPEVVDGCDARVLHVARVRMPAWDRSWAATEGLELPAGIHLCANWESRAGIPGRIAAAERVADSLVEPVE